MTFFLSAATSFLIALMMIPTLISIARQRNIFDEPGQRKIHSIRVPLLGGVAIFSATVISFLFWGFRFIDPNHLFILVSLLILFFTGFTDDIRPVAPASKLFLQLTASFITVAFAGVRIEGLHGLFNVYTLPEGISIGISVCFIMFLINAFNFIDGIDGLAASIGIIATAVFGTLFMMYGDGMFAVLSFALAGSLVAFLIFNRTPARIFMGDTGSMLAGFVLALMAIRLTEQSGTTPWSSHDTTPVLALSLLIVPVIDFFHVTAIRIFRGRSPFRADQNHVHHRLVELGLTHMQVTALLAVVNVLFILNALMFRDANQSSVFYLILISGFCLSQIPYLLRRYRAT